MECGFGIGEYIQHVEMMTVWGSEHLDASGEVRLPGRGQFRRVAAKLVGFLPTDGADQPAMLWRPEARGRAVFYLTGGNAEHLQFLDLGEGGQIIKTGKAGHAFNGFYRQRVIGPMCRHHHGGKMGAC